MLTAAVMNTCGYVIMVVISLLNYPVTLRKSRFLFTVQQLTMIFVDWPGFFLLSLITEIIKVLLGDGSPISNRVSICLAVVSKDLEHP